MKYLKLLAKLIFTVYLPISPFAAELNSCPSFNSQSMLTKNIRGNSSYTDPDLLNFFKSFFSQNKFNLKKPILDIGAGYGGATYQLIKLGAKDIYANDLDKRNLMCMKKHIKYAYGDKNFQLKFISGDIVSEAVVSQLPNDAFSLIFAKNVIHFFTYKQLIQFIKILNQKSSKDGLVIITFENPYINNLSMMIDGIFKMHKKYPKISLDHTVENAYMHFRFPISRNCSVKAYNQAPPHMKLPGFPCEMTGNGGQVQLLLPRIFIDLMNASGFNYIYSKSYSNYENTQLLIFSKKDNIAEKKINENIKRIFNRRISVVKSFSPNVSR